MLLDLLGVEALDREVWGTYSPLARNGEGGGRDIKVMRFSQFKSTVPNFQLSIPLFNSLNLFIEWATCWGATHMRWKRRP